MRNISKRNGLVVPFHDRNDCSVWKPCCCEDRPDPPDPEPDCGNFCPADYLRNRLENDLVQINGNEASFSTDVNGTPSSTTMTVTPFDGDTTATVYVAPVSSFGYPEFEFDHINAGATGNEVGTIVVATSVAQHITLRIQDKEFTESPHSLLIGLSPAPTAVQTAATNNGDGTWTIPAGFGTDYPGFIFECTDEVTITVFKTANGVNSTFVTVEQWDLDDQCL